MTRHATKQRSALNRWLPLVAWALGAVAVAAFTVWLLSLRTIGADIASTLSLLVAVVSAIAPVAIKSLRESFLGSRHEPNPKAMRVVIAIVVVAIVSGALFWWFESRSDINITSDLTMTGAAGMRDGSVATIDAGDRLAPPERDNLAIAFSLRNPAATGDCVGPAQLAVGLVIDGQPLDFGTNRPPVRPGAEVSLELDSVTRKVQVVVVLSTPDPACEVDLIVDRAILYS